MLNLIVSDNLTDEFCKVNVQITHFWTKRFSFSHSKHFLDNPEARINSLFDLSFWEKCDGKKEIKSGKCGKGRIGELFVMWVCTVCWGGGGGGVVNEG